MEENFETIAKQIVDTVQKETKDSGNCITEVTKVMQAIFQNGTAGKEQDADVVLRILDKMFRLANSQENTSNLWKSIAALAIIEARATA